MRVAGKWRSSSLPTSCLREPLKARWAKVWKAWTAWTA